MDLAPTSLTIRLVALLAVNLACSVVCGQTTASAGLAAYPPAPKMEPHQETVYGISVDDPYRWMELPARRDEMVRWIEASSAQAKGALAMLPGRAGLLKELQIASEASAEHYNVQEAGDRLFFLELSPDANVPVLKVREKGQDRVLVNPEAGMSAQSHRAINNYTPSHDGKLVAVHIAEGGGEVGSTYFFDVETGTQLADTLTPVWGQATVNWIDSKTLTYLRMNPGTSQEEAIENMNVYLHRMGSHSSSDVPILGAKVGAGFPMSAVEFGTVMTIPGSRWTIVLGGGARPDRHVGYGLSRDLNAVKPDWHELANFEDRINDLDVSGDTLYFLSTAHDPNGEVRRLELGKETLPSSHLVMGSNGAVLKNIFVTTAGLYVRTMNPDASSHLLFLARNSPGPVEIKLPIDGEMSDFALTADRSALIFGLDGIQQNITYYQLHGRALHSLGVADKTQPEADGMVVVQKTATSADGTKVPLTIVSRRGPVKVSPTILGAYASYGHSEEPFYSPSTVVWVSRGGVAATCHARGGGEKGRAWHEAGRSANKVNAMADVIACGERLVELGYTTPKLLGLFGASAGGLLVTPVGLRRPDLFAATVTSVGIVNPTRLAAANNGPNQFAEMGDPHTETGFRALAQQDSTLLLAKSQGGPDQLFLIGLNDRRVDPWQSAKLAAMMREKWGNRYVVLMRADSDAGHGIGSSRTQYLEERADSYAFFLNRFRQPGFVSGEPH